MRPSEFAPHLNAGSVTLHAVTLGTRGECATTSSSSSTSSGDDARRWSVRGSSTDTTGRARAPSGKPRVTHGSARRRRSLLAESDCALEISRHPRTGSFRARRVSASSASDDRVDAAGRRGYDEYGRVPKEQFRADVIANFPKFILASAGLIASAVAIDLFRFSRLMRRGGAEARWNDLASGENSGKDGLGGEPTVIYDVCGRVVATLSSRLVRLRDVAAPAWQAIVATEDHRFFRHRGVDVNGLGRAVVSLGRLGGGSTITQQLIKNMVLSNDRTVTRKLAEILLALELEKRLSKEQTLEAYVNNVYWGHGAFGIAAASAAYFGKTPAQLDIGEASLLAALLPCPEALSPYANPSGALRARKTALAQMARHGYLTDDEAKEWGDAPLPRTLELRAPTELQKSTGLEGVDDFADVYATRRRGLGAGARLGPSDNSLNRGKSAPYRAPFFVSEALSELADLLEGREDVLARGGLKVHTTLDLDLQEKAEQLVLEDGLTTIRGRDKGEAALVAVDPANGGVRVLIGSRDYGASAHNRAVRARRCVGSAFRPFVYLAALQSGAVTPSTLLIDEPHAFEIPPSDEEHDESHESHDESHESHDGSRPWRHARTYTPPANGDGRGHRGVVSARECLADSLNVPTVKVAQTVGVEAVAATARACGIRSPTPTTLPSMSLGVGADVTPCELASAYATIANRGMYVSPHLVSEVKDADGKLVYRHKGVTHKAVGKDATGKLGGLLRDAVVALERRRDGDIIGQTGSADDDDATGSRGSSPFGPPPFGRTTSDARVNGFVTAPGAPVLAGVAGTGVTSVTSVPTDAWFAGYAPGLACAVWCGRDDSTELPGGGEALAAPLWGRFMRAAGARGATGERDGREGRRRRRRRRTDKRRGVATV